MNNKLTSLLTIGLILIFKISLYAQSPNLGSTDSFALFTTAGAFSNTGSSYIIGNVGNNVGAFTGFPPGVFVGSVHLADSVTAQAAADLDTAYNDLVGLSCGTTIGTTLGSNQVLTPDVYCIGAAASLSGNLILDGQGDPNAIFIIKINGLLSTAAASNVLLIDSASTCNVYWQVNGAVNLGDSSVFRGNILANGAISLLDSATLEGRALSITGAINLNNNNVNICFIPLIPMPVTLLSFKAEKGRINSVAEISWQSVTDIEAGYFDVERSADGITFVKIGRLMMNVIGNSISSYNFTDVHPYPGINFYRLYQHNVSGKENISHTIILNFSALSADIRIAPNPFASFFELTIKDATEDNVYHSIIYNAMGKVMQDISVDKLSTIIDTRSFSPGIYFYYILLGNEMVKSGKLVSQ